jgi:hypothetical protein
MTNPFSLFDIPGAAFILFAIIAPARFYQVSKFPAERAATWLPRVRPLGIAVLILFVAGRFLMFKLFPPFQHLIEHLNR